MCIYCLCCCLFVCLFVLLLCLLCGCKDILSVCARLKGLQAHPQVRLLPSEESHFKVHLIVKFYLEQVKWRTWLIV